MEDYERPWKVEGGIENLSRSILSNSRMKAQILPDPRLAVMPA